MNFLLRDEAKEALVTGAKPGESFWHSLIDSLVFKSDDLRALFIVYATQAEAEAGIEDTKIMTALRVQQVINTLKANVSEDGDTLHKLRGLIARLEAVIIGEGNNNAVLDKWQEVKTFLTGIPEHTTGLMALLNKKSDTYVGDYKSSVQSADHGGWLLCAGGAVSREGYAALFALIGTAFGEGDGASTFNLPDMRGRTAIAQGTGTALTNRNLGDAIGAEKHTLTVAELAAHKHTIRDAGHNHRYDRGIQTGSFNSSNNRTGKDWDENRDTSRNGTGIQINNEGGDQPHNNMQPSLAVGNWFIYSGVLF